MIRVFVYGTLKRGGSNHRLLARADFLGTCVTSARFSLYDLGEYPAAVPGGHTAIHGEVYRLRFPELRRLDALEDYPRLYTRRLIGTPYGPAWIYLMAKAHVKGHPRLSGGHWPVPQND